MASCRVNSQQVSTGVNSQQVSTRVNSQQVSIGVNSGSCTVVYYSTAYIVCAVSSVDCALWCRVLRPAWVYTITKTQYSNVYSDRTL